MAKLGIFASLTAIVCALGLASMQSAEGADACTHTEFKTEMVKNACAKGGQAAAKEAMKEWNKEKKIKSCNDCHSSLAPKYELKPGGLKKYQDLGGK